MMKTFLAWLFDWLLAKAGDGRVAELRADERKQVEDAKTRMDAIKPSSRKSAADRLRDGTA